jgi:4-carboxymuconolactone decarboxylase
MPRMKDLTVAELTPAQKQVYDAIAAGPRGQVHGGPFHVWLREPGFADKAQALGANLRFNKTLPLKVTELAILMVARHWSAQFEWFYHKQVALKAGLDPRIIDAIHARQQPAGMAADEAAAHAFANELLEKKKVSEPTYQAALKALGEAGIAVLTGVIGYYSLVAMTLNAFEIPLPAGETLPFKE